MKAKTTTDLGDGLDVTFDGQWFELKKFGHIFLNLKEAKALMNYLQAHLEGK